MKRVSVLLLLLSGCLVAGWAALQSSSMQGERPLSTYAPQGSLLYLEAKDFSGLLADWNRSPEKQRWLSSDNYGAFSRSRLLLRLKDASDQFSAAAGVPPGMNFLSQVAGKESAFALYDIGKLQFLYITQLPSANSMQTALWQTRAKFETRNAGGIAYFLRRDPESGREVEFAITGNYLVLATREDLMASALELMALGKGASTASEAWWAKAVAATGAPGDLRMVLNLERIVPSPYFRSYWIQQNVPDMKQYGSAVSDLFRSGKEYREERVLLRKTPDEEQSTASEGFTAAAELVPLVPAEAGFYRIQADPSPEMCFDWLQSKILAPRPGAGPASRYAPQVQLTSGTTGDSTDLETRIDQPPPQVEDGAGGADELKALLDQAGVLGILQSDRSAADPQGVFVRVHSVVAFSAAKNWDEAAVRDALGNYARPAYTAGALGTSWEVKRGYQLLDGLWPLAFAVRGKLLVIADDPATLEAALQGATQKSNAKPAEYLAGFRHGHEQPNFLRLVDFLDRSGGGPVYPKSERTPQFFSQNVGSLSEALSGLASETVSVRAQPGKVTQTVVYEWNR